MSEDPPHDWENLNSNHPAAVAFNEAATKVRRLKATGVGWPGPIARNSDLVFLRHNNERLRKHAHRPTRYERQVDEFIKGDEASGFGASEEEICQLLGCSPEDIRSAVNERRYLLDQFLMMGPRHWHDPALSMLYSACQAACHEIFWRTVRETEPSITNLLAAEVRSTLGRDFADVLRKQGVGLPCGSSLTFGTAFMQGWEDRLGSDIAIVLGTTIEGRPMYRVVLLQAKMESAAGDADVYRDAGSQLNELLATGMGYYLFYPRVWQNEQRFFLPTVRRAENVFRDVWAGSEAPARKVDTCYGMVARDVAWDLPTFVSIAMVSQNARGCGRVFPDVESVCDALSDEKRRLTTFVAYSDLTDRLHVRDFQAALSNRGYMADDPVTAPVERRRRPDAFDGEDGEPGGATVVPKGPG